MKLIEEDAKKVDYLRKVMHDILKVIDLYIIPHGTSRDVLEIGIMDVLDYNLNKYLVLPRDEGKEDEK